MEMGVMWSLLAGTQLVLALHVGTRSISAARFIIFAAFLSIICALRKIYLS